MSDHVADRGSSGSGRLRDRGDPVAPLGGGVQVTYHDDRVWDDPTFNPEPVDWWPEPDPPEHEHEWGAWGFELLRGWTRHCECGAFHVQQKIPYV